jgi:hypothetical protein
VILTDDAEVPPLESLSLEGFTVHPGRLCAPTGELAKVQVRFIVPSYVLPAVSVTVAVPLFPAEMAAGVVAVSSTATTVMLVDALLGA